MTKLATTLTALAIVGLRYCSYFGTLVNYL
jgi:hypothetical protein